MSTMPLDLDHCFEKDGKHRAYCVTPWRDTAEERNNDLRDIQTICSRLDAAEKEAKESYQHAEAEAHAHDECRKELEKLKSALIDAWQQRDNLHLDLTKSKALAITMSQMHDDECKENQELKDELEQLKEANAEWQDGRIQKELEELRESAKSNAKDRERLDWLEKEKPIVNRLSLRDIADSDYWHLCWGNWEHTTHFGGIETAKLSLRQAIDAAAAKGTQ
jgi:hypothetical protein